MTTANGLRKRPAPAKHLPPSDGEISRALRDHLDGTAGCSESCMSAWKRTPWPRKAIPYGLNGEPSRCKVSR